MVGMKSPESLYENHPIRNAIAAVALFAGSGAISATIESAPSAASADTITHQAELPGHTVKVPYECTNITHKTVFNTLIGSSSEWWFDMYPNKG